MTLPQVLDTGDGKTIDRDLDLEATRHILIAMKFVLGVPTLRDPGDHARPCRADQPAEPTRLNDRSRDEHVHPGD